MMIAAHALSLGLIVVTYKVHRSDWPSPSQSRIGAIARINVEVRS